MWMDQLQVLDLEAVDRLELTCRRCGHVRYLEAVTLQARPAWRQLYLAEVQARTRCRMRGCGGAMRMALPRSHKSSGFVGGVA